MNITVLDGGTTNPGDISWEPLEVLGTLTVYDSTPAELVVSRGKGAEALILNRIALNRDILSKLPELRFVGMLATGYNAIDIKAAGELGITVCNVPDYCADTVAQQAISLLLCLCGNVHRYSETVRTGHWEEAVAMNHSAFPICELSGKTLGIVGYGSIGQKVAKIGCALGMKVLFYNRSKKAGQGNCSPVGLQELFEKSDVVSLHCPLTEETRGLVGKDLLSRMKPTAFLINTARGGVVDSFALTEALNSGKLAGAGLDVLDKEPPDPHNPLLTAKNCVITPHIAWASREARARLVAAVTENLRAFQKGNPINVVNRAFL